MMEGLSVIGLVYMYIWSEESLHIKCIFNHAKGVGIKPWDSTVQLLLSVM